MIDDGVALQPSIQRAWRVHAVLAFPQRVVHSERYFTVCIGSMVGIGWWSVGR